MIRASELSGRPVVDIDAAGKLGRIDTIIIDPEARRVAAFLVSHGGTFQKGKAPTGLPAALTRVSRWQDVHSRWRS